MKTKTTLVLPDHLMRELERRAAERGETLSAVVAETLQRGLAGPQARIDVVPLPTHPMGQPRVEVAYRDRLYDLMEKS